MGRAARLESSTLLSQLFRAETISFRPALPANQSKSRTILSISLFKIVNEALSNGFVTRSQRYVRTLRHATLDQRIASSETKEKTLARD